MRTKDLEKAGIPVFSNREHTKRRWVHVGNRIRIHRQPSDPDGDFVDYYDATVQGVWVMVGSITLVLADIRVYNTDVQPFDAEHLNLDQAGLRFIEVLDARKKPPLPPLVKARDLPKKDPKKA